MGTDNPSGMKSSIPDGAMAALSSGGNLPFLPEPNIPVVRSGLESIGQSISGLGMNVAQFGLAVAQNKQEIDQREDAVERFRLQNEYELALAEETEKFKVGFQEAGEAGELYSQQHQQKVVTPLSNKFQQLAGGRLRRPESRAQFAAAINEGTTRARLGAMKEELGVRYVQASEKFNDSVDSLTVLADRKAVEGTPEQTKTFLLDKATETLALYQKLIGPILPQLSPEMQLALQKQLDSTRFNFIEQVINRRFLSGDLAGAEELRRDPELQSLMGSKLPDFTQKFDIRMSSEVTKQLTVINQQAEQNLKDYTAAVVNGGQTQDLLAARQKLQQASTALGHPLQNEGKFVHLAEAEKLYKDYSNLLSAARSTEEYDQIALTLEAAAVANGSGAADRLEMVKQFISADREKHRAVKESPHLIGSLAEQTNAGVPLQDQQVVPQEDVRQFYSNVTRLVKTGKAKEILGTLIPYMDRFKGEEYQVFLRQVEKEAGPDGKPLAAAIALLPQNPAELTQASGKYQKLINMAAMGTRQQSEVRQHLKSSIGGNLEISEAQMVSYFDQRVEGFREYFSLPSDASEQDKARASEQKVLTAYYLAAAGVRVETDKMGASTGQLLFGLNALFPNDVEKAHTAAFSELFNVGFLKPTSNAGLILKDQGSATAKIAVFGKSLTDTFTGKGTAGILGPVGSTKPKVQWTRPLVVPKKRNGDNLYGNDDVIRIGEKMAEEILSSDFQVGIQGKTVAAQTVPLTQVFSGIQQNIFSVEAGYVAKDGVTNAPANRGINLAYHRDKVAAVLGPNFTDAQFKAMTPTQAQTVYAQIVAPVQADLMKRGVVDPKLATLLTDTYYHDQETYHKVIRKFSTPQYQSQMKLSPADEKNIPVLDKLYSEMRQARLDHLKTLSSWAKYGNGWENQRLPKLDKQALKLRQDFYLKSPQFVLGSQAEQESVKRSIRTNGLFLRDLPNKKGVGAWMEGVNGELVPVVDKYGRQIRRFW